MVPARTPEGAQPHDLHPRGHARRSPPRGSSTWWWPPDGEPPPGAPAARRRRRPTSRTSARPPLGDIRSLRRWLLVAAVWAVAATALARDRADRGEQGRQTPTRTQAAGELGRVQRQLNDAHRRPRVAGRRAADLRRRDQARRPPQGRRGQGRQEHRATDRLAAGSTTSRGGSTTSSARRGARVVRGRHDDHSVGADAPTASGSASIAGPGKGGGPSLTDRILGTLEVSGR